MNRLFLHVSVLCLAAVLTDTMTNAQSLQDAQSEAISALVDSHAGEQVILTVPFEHQLLGHIENRALDEASGLALSTRSDKIAWSHNDSGNGPYLYAFSLTGETRGRFYLDKARSRDWEDMDAFRWQGQSWLLVADTGDNQSKKSDYVLYLVGEPDVPAERSTRLKPLRGALRATFTLPTGPADTEAVAVDELEERVYLITKRRRPALVFSLPLSVFSDGDETHEARLETTLYSLPRPTLQDIVGNPNLGLAYGQPNALDLAPDRSFAVVHTYGHSYLFRRHAEQTWAQAFAAAPEQIEVPSMKQSEAVAIGLDSRTIYYTSEGKKPPLYRLLPVNKAPLEKESSQ